MSEQIDTTPIDKSTWGPGPWQDEPDRVEFTHCGLPCLALRNPHHGDWCGYVAVPPGHPLHGMPHGLPDIDVHGGLTYASLCADAICHVPPPGDPADVWWFGFDCHHAFDIAPGMDALLRSIGASMLPRPVMPKGWEEVYRDLPYVRGEIISLAEQLASLSTAVERT